VGVASADRAALGNPEGPDKPNKKHSPPRHRLWLGEQGLSARVIAACKNLGSFDNFGF
jgi:hypothetical protein